MRAMTWLAVALILAASLAGAADDAWDTVSAESATRVGFEPTAQPLDDAEVALLLADGLTREEAAALALARNATLRAAFAELGIAEADLRQAGLYSNPELDTVIRWPEGEGDTEIEIESGWNIADLWRVPVRRDLERARAAQVTMTVIREVVVTAAAARTAWDEARAGALAMEETAAVLAAALDLRDQVAHRWEFGFHSDLDVARMEAEVADAEVALAMAEAEARVALARLVRVLGLPAGSEPELTGDLPVAPEDALDAEALTDRALAQRPELHAAALGVTAAEARLRLERRSTWDSVAVGPAWTRETDGAEFWGLHIALELPLADSNAAGRARARAAMHRADSELAAAEAMVREEVAVALEELRLAGRREELLRTGALPARERAAQFAQQHAMQMELSLLPVLETRRELAQTRLMLVEARRQVARALVALDVALGGGLERDARW